MKIGYLSESVKLSFEINSLGSFILTYSFENSSIPNSSFSISFDGNDTSFTVLYPKYFKVAPTAVLKYARKNKHKMLVFSHITKNNNEY